MPLDQRKPPIRSKKLTDAAHGKPCVMCGGNAETVVACHYQGKGAGRLGKGRGIKPHDFATADLCAKCHDEMDSYANGNDYERAFDFLMAIMETLERRWRDGVIGDGRR